MIERSAATPSRPRYAPEFYDTLAAGKGDGGGKDVGNSATSVCPQRLALGAGVVLGELNGPGYEFKYFRSHLAHAKKRESAMNHLTGRNELRALTRPTSGRPSTESAKLPRYFTATVLCLLSMSLVFGCTSTKITEREHAATEQLPKLPRPEHIFVYDFAATPADVPAYSNVISQFSVATKPQTPEQIELGRKVGAELATQLAEAIRDMGMPGVHATHASMPEVNDLVFRGYIVSVDKGSMTKRLTIGFGYGAAEMKVALEAFQKTAKGMRKIGGGAAQSGGGGLSPGTAAGAVAFAATANPVGLIVSSAVKVSGEVTGSSEIEGRVKDAVKEIAAVLKQRFQEQGWID